MALRSNGFLSRRVGCVRASRAAGHMVELGRRCSDGAELLQYRTLSSPTTARGRDRTSERSGGPAYRGRTEPNQTATSSS